MIWMENFRMAMSSLMANKLRSLLTMLGIIIGVGSVVAMISVGQGAQQSITNQIGSLGSNLLFVGSGRLTAVPGASTGARGASSLITMKEYELLLQAKGELIAEVVPEAGKNFVIRYDKNNTTTQVTGTMPAYPRVRNLNVAMGRFFNDQDVAYRSTVAVIGQTAAADLFKGVNPIGKKIRIGQAEFTVIGVMESKLVGNNDMGDQVFVPITTAQKRLLGDNRLRTITIAATSAETLNDAQVQVEAILTRSLGKAEMFTIRNQQDVLTTIQSTTATLTMLLGGITGISLVVGGIGIMNIMLVSVTERTREIGIRKALGAKQKHILSQFLIESTTVSSLGGFIGILAGIGISYLIARLGQWNTAVSLYSIVVAFGFSALVGIFFGFYPAKRAASLDPIEALRYE